MLKKKMFSISIKLNFYFTFFARESLSHDSKQTAAAGVCLLGFPGHNCTSPQACSCATVNHFYSTHCTLLHLTGANGQRLVRSKQV